MLKYEIILIFYVCQLLIHMPALAKRSDTTDANSKYYLTPQRTADVISYDPFKHQPAVESLLKGWTDSIKFDLSQEDLAMPASSENTEAKTETEETKEEKLQTMKKDFKSETPLRSERRTLEANVNSYDSLSRCDSSDKLPHCRKYDKVVNERSPDHCLEMLRLVKQQAIWTMKYADKVEYEILTHLEANHDPEKMQEWKRIVKDVKNAPPSAAYLRGYKKMASKGKQKLADLEVPRMPHP